MKPSKQTKANTQTKSKKPAPALEKRELFGCRISQRKNEKATQFFVFYARAKDIRRWAGIRRTSESVQGVQRLLRPTRVTAIRRFLQADARNSIPNNILIAFNKDVAKFTSIENKINKSISPTIDIKNKCASHLEWGTIDFTFDPNQEENKRPIQVVDGQHRLHGMASLEDEDVPILVVALLDASVQEQAFQFIVINNKATRVPTDNVKAIIEGIHEDELRERLLDSGVPYGKTSPALREIDQLIKSSPFYGLLDWDLNKTGKRLVSLTTIESALRYIKSVFEGLHDDEDTIIQVFIAIWSAVKEAYHKSWGKENIFMTKANINALNEFLADKLKGAWEFDQVDIFDTKSIQNRTHQILKQIPEEFWEQSWNIKVQDNANVRSLIKTDVETIFHNTKLGHPWNSELRLLIGSNDSE